MRLKLNVSRTLAIALVAGASVWILSGYLIPHETPESKAAVRSNEQAPKLFRVAVMDAKIEQHRRRLILSGRTEADRKVMAIARAGGILTELRVKRGQLVQKGEIIAVLSDEAREAQVAQARALLTQRNAELEARRKLIATGAVAKLELVNLEAQAAAAEATLSAAEAERERGVVRAPWAGVVTDVPAEVGTSALSMTGGMGGAEIAKIIALDPMLAVVEAAERNLGGIKVGAPAEIRLVTGQKVQGRVRFVSKSAVTATRTYRVEVEIPNADGDIADGITAEVALRMEPQPATRVSRSALTFSSSGALGVRAVDDADTVQFVPVSVIEDDQADMWVAGIPDGARVIVQGQDFVREGQKVQPIPTSAMAKKVSEAAAQP
jgi:membrane fusion protein, multidrug efflux system